MSNKAKIPWRVVEIWPIADEYCLHLKFADGWQGEIDLSDLILGPEPGVFAELADPQKFAAVYVNDGVPTWPNGQRIDPEAAWQEVSSRDDNDLKNAIYEIAEGMHRCGILSDEDFWEFNNPSESKHDKIAIHYN